MARTPKNYNGTDITSQRFSDVLPKVLEKITENYQDRPDLILASWPSVIGEKLAPMAQAVSFSEGVLTVRVKNATLYSLLVGSERFKLLESLRIKFPKVEIKHIHFRMG